MARLQIEVQPDAGVRGYSLFVDGLPVTMGEGHRGEASCDGSCGDGSSHALLYSFSGAPGSSLTVVVRCGGREVCRIAAARIAERAVRSVGRQLFDL